MSDQPKVEQYTAGILNGLKTAISYDTKLHRSTYLLTMGTGANNTRAYNVLGYDALSRLNTVTRGSFVTTYTYKPHSNLLSSLQHTAGATTTGSAAYTHDNLDRVKSLTWTMNPGGTPTTDAFSYRYDAKGHRDRATDPDGSYWKFQYDTLGQVTSGRRYMPAGVAQSEDDDLDVPGYRFGYSFDHIGNRTETTATDGVASFSTLPRLATYSANLLNQYTERTVPRVLDIAGYAPGTVTVDSQAVWRTGLAAPYDQYYWFPKEWPSVNSAFAAGVTVSHLAQPLNVFLPATPEQFTYDVDGNLTQDGRWNYSWDGENRLIAMEVRDELKPLFAQPLRLQFSYDSQHRRVRKVVLVPNPPGGSGGTGNATSGGGGNVEENPEVLTPSGMTGIDEGATEVEPGTTLASTINVGWTVITDIRFAWDGWLLSAELNNSGGLIRGYCWGIDLSGSRGGAAGIGGLLYTQDGGNALTNSNIRYVTSDSRGDVRAVYNSSGTLQARFEYGPFGEPTAVAGSASSSFPIRFSSKYADQETGLSYYGRRYFILGVCRWASRDPKGEVADFNVYNVCHGDPVSRVDMIGLDDFKRASPKSPAKRPPRVQPKVDFVYNGRRATDKDHSNWDKYGDLLDGATVVGHLPDACKLYSHFRSAEGTEVNVDYKKYYRDDPSRTSIDDEIAAAQRAAESMLENGESCDDSFYLYSTSFRQARYPQTENWQKALGDHTIWGEGPVTYDSKLKLFEMNIVINAEDYYDFNKQQGDIKWKSLKDEDNGAFVELGWAKNFWVRGQFVMKVKWKKGNIRTPAAPSGPSSTRNPDRTKR